MLATLTPKSRVRVFAVIATCETCDGWHLANGYKASLFQVHRPTAGGLICDGCCTRRPLLVAGESIPVKVGRWPNLPDGIAATREP